MAPQPPVPACPSSRAARLRTLLILAGLAFLCLLALRAPAFAEEAAADAPDDEPVPREAVDITDKVTINGMKLQVKNGNTWTDVPDGGSIPNWSYVRIYIDWEIKDMTGVNPGDTFTFTVDPQGHMLSGNFGPANLVDPGTSKVIGSYVVNGNRNQDGSMNDNMITIVTTISEDGAQFPSLHNGFFSLEGYVQGAGNDIVFTVNGEALAPVDIEPEPSTPIPDFPLFKYGSQEAGQNQIRWVAHVNSDLVKSAYADYAAGGSTQVAQRTNLLLTDELQGGQAISSDDVVVRMPIYATTNAGEAQSQQYASFVITSLFDTVDKSAADGMTQEEFANSVRGAATPTIGVWENRVVYVGFGDVPSGDGTSTLNVKNIFDGNGEAVVEYVLDQAGVTPTQKAIVMKYFSSTGPNGGDITSFLVEMRADASEDGLYENTATLTYGDSSSSQWSGNTYFTEISGGVEVRDGKAVLTKVDAGDAGIALPGAVFKLEKMQPDNSWATVAGSERLTTDSNGLITVTGLLLGQYRFVEIEPPAGYVMESEPIGFAITSTMTDHTATVTAENTKSPVLGKVVLTKVDADDETVKLPGAVFKLEELASDGSWVDVPGHEALATDGGGLIEVDNLTMGTYRFVEASAPEGYELETTPVEFTLAEDTPGLEVAVTAPNTKSPVFGSAILKKVDAEDPTAVLPGAAFRLDQRLADGTWGAVPGHESLTTGADGLIEARDLPVGSYRFVETAAPDGYVLDDTPREFAIDAAAPAPIVVNLTAENAKEPPRGKAVLTKVDADDESVKLPGAVFKLETQQPDGSWETVTGSERLTTDENGVIEVADLLLGTYRFVEVAPPESYELETEPIEFVLDETVPDYAAAVTATNKKTPVLGGAVLTKVDSDDAAKVLSGATFKLERHLADDTWAVVDGYEALVTDDQGVIEVRDLPVGSYRFVETAAPEGYVLDETPVEFTVAVGQPAQAELTMKNVPVPPDPVDPVDPVDPTDPTDPSTPGTPGTPGTTQPPKSGTSTIASRISSIARTGDGIPLAALGVLGAVGAGALATALVVARRRARRS